MIIIDQQDNEISGCTIYFNINLLFITFCFIVIQNESQSLEIKKKECIKNFFFCFCATMIDIHLKYFKCANLFVIHAMLVFVINALHIMYFA
jgi:hypothetical protein